MKYPNMGKSNKLLSSAIALIALSKGLTQVQAADSLCQTATPLVPSFNNSILTILYDEEYKSDSIERLSGAVQIPTIIQDVNPDPADNPDYYAEFTKLHEYLKETFPLVHEHLTLELVNHYGLLYTWQGNNTSLQPMLFTAHQDVVPVENTTLDQWDFPPFSGHYDDATDFIYGRGAFDVKNLIIAHMEAIEKLLEDGYSTERTVLLAYGFDEESGGALGAGYIAPLLQDRYGENGVMVMFDEGAGVLKLDDSHYVATVTNAEKGTMNLVVTVNGKGGHSSSPPDHTTIGVAADFITVLENNPFGVQFNVQSPLYGLLTCAAEYSDDLPSDLKNLILGAADDTELETSLANFLVSNDMTKNYVRTTQAVDIVNGGVKINALPESAYFIVNHRIAFGSSVEETRQRVMKYANETAVKFDYGLVFEGNEIIPATDNGYIDVDLQRLLEPAPVTASSGPVWDLMAGTVSNLFENNIFAQKGEDSDIFITTAVVTGNTDSRHYWNVTDTIYRFTGGVTDPEILATMHTVNEHMSMDAHLQSTAFFYEFIVNANEHGSSI
ncbi:similar to Saccharomyces cerevisiae YJL172W CPS1 Vacuolar carboxypeptidase yscS [Maudiozyma saulgeensis]|uniref:Similar to Saccharomyces cerevisiae YJL172W CPS1 Vacuolar carboxypeptidase yscS n=1 Tax=Maudiozyma saulgeensis TaxID=1789683 RepID=A0A1X7RB27_9SACH|nr:similar to Saccharomyces cerevisiae YJL172W CPS1 Vacuolar carboxypeptidase yscS [Kazachstania saulgeensis]